MSQTWKKRREEDALVCKRRFILIEFRMAEVGSLSARAKMATKVFVRRVFAIFATNASFLRVIANLQIQFSIICNIYHVIVAHRYAIILLK